ncbi:integrase, catalytic region, zinc finger, CCHC-type containing protein [Tanacetum coccineum]|uniref:Integrase, catalytic region, zinc finger, CCHC-type containing protein n=1 Tax=Tanacetum coccineum TaxID=301880 RepID=A0ABQ5FSB4_9ASTR
MQSDTGARNVTGALIVSGHLVVIDQQQVMKNDLHVVGACRDEKTVSVLKFVAIPFILLAGFTGVSVPFVGKNWRHLKADSSLFIATKPLLLGIILATGTATCNLGQISLHFAILKPQKLWLLSNVEEQIASLLLFSWGGLMASFAAWAVMRRPAHLAGVPWCLETALKLDVVSLPPPREIFPAIHQLRQVTYAWKVPSKDSVASKAIASPEKEKTSILLLTANAWWPSSFGKFQCYDQRNRCICPSNFMDIQCYIMFLAVILLPVSLRFCNTLIPPPILKGIERMEAESGEVQHMESEAIIKGGRDLRGQLRPRPLAMNMILMSQNVRDLCGLKVQNDYIFTYKRKLLLHSDTVKKKNTIKETDRGKGTSPNFMKGLLKNNTKTDLHTKRFTSGKDKRLTTTKIPTIGKEWQSQEIHTNASPPEDSNVFSHHLREEEWNGGPNDLSKIENGAAHFVHEGRQPLSWYRKMQIGALVCGTNYKGHVNVAFLDLTVGAVGSSQPEPDVSYGCSEGNHNTLMYVGNSVFFQFRTECRTTPAEDVTTIFADVATSMDDVGVSEIRSSGGCMPHVVTTGLFLFHLERAKKTKKSNNSFSSFTFPDSTLAQALTVVYLTKDCLLIDGSHEELLNRITHSCCLDALTEGVELCNPHVSMLPSATGCRQIVVTDNGQVAEWRERFMNYLEEQTDGEAMINSIQNGDHPLPVIAQVSLAGTAPNAPPTLKDPKFWTAEEKKNRKIDRLARSLLIQGLPNDIYSLIDSNDTAKDLWDALERQMRGSEYGEQDRKAAILYEYETFKATEGEQLLDTYLRYLQVINDLKKCGYKKDNCELNYKFLNNLQPEWKQYGTLMRQTKNLMDINIDALYNILKQNQGDVNEAMGHKKKAVVVTSDPLALVAEKTKVSKRKEKVVVKSESEGSDDEDISDLKKITALLAKAFNRKKYYAKPTNNNLRTSSASSSANKKQEYVKSEEKKEDKKADEKKRDMSKVKCYNCKKEGHFAKDCKKAKVKDYNYYKTKMLLAKKDSDEQVLLAEDQAWMESSSDSDQEINANMVFMAKMEKVLSDSEEKETIAEIVQICLWIIDSGCSKHMTGNRALLTNFVEKFLGTVHYGNNDFAVIAGYGDVVIGSMTIKKVYYVKV